MKPRPGRWPLIPLFLVGLGLPALMLSLTGAGLAEIVLMLSFMGLMTATSAWGLVVMLAYALGVILHGFGVRRARAARRATVITATTLLAALLGAVLAVMLSEDRAEAAISSTVAGGLMIIMGRMVMCPAGWMGLRTLEREVRSEIITRG